MVHMTTVATTADGDVAPRPVWPFCQMSGILLGQCFFFDCVITEKSKY